MKAVSIIVPCYNEEAVLKLFYQETQKVLDTITDYSFHYIFVDDGSSDKTLLILKELSRLHAHVDFLSFSRNFGKEAGMYAGLTYADGDYVIIMDADLQHPPALIPDMLREIEAGHDCCAAMRISRTGESKIRSAFSRCFYRISREGESALRSWFSQLFYKLSNHMTDVQMPQNAVDYRIMSRQMVDAVLSLSEVQRFSKGIFSWVGFDTKWLPYKNVERTIGKTKWSFWGLFKYAIDGITAFSVAPLRMVSALGFIISCFAFLYIIITLIQTLAFGIVVPGYVTTLCAVLFLGGIIELSIGILGEYIGHIYMEAKDRPIFILKASSLKDRK